MIYRISLILLAFILEIIKAAPSNFLNPFVITSGNCEKNISVKYQIPVTRTRINHQQQQQEQQSDNEIYAYTEKYFDYEERIRWDTVHLCCPGYRTIIFGLCEPICMPTCPPHSYCAEPNECVCMRGYEPSHHPNKEHQLICRPICMHRCPDHSHCKAPNKCECRAGFKDVSSWFSQLRCERIQCTAADERYDVQKNQCVKIEMSVAELMQIVGEELANGVLDTTKSYNKTKASFDNDSTEQKTEIGVTAEDM